MVSQDPALNDVNLAQLQLQFLPKPVSDFKFPAADPLPSLVYDLSDATPPIICNDLDYDARRMSSSAASGVSTSTDSSVPSSRTGDKRPPSPDASPLPKRARPTLSLDRHYHQPQSPASNDAPSGQRTPESGDASKVQLPPIFSAFEGPFAGARRPDLEARRGSLPNLYSDSLGLSRARLSAPSGLRGAWQQWPDQQQQQSVSPSSGLSAYQFPSPSESGDERHPNGRPRLAADTQLGALNEADYPFPPASGYSTNSSNSSAFPQTPLDSYTRQQGSLSQQTSHGQQQQQAHAYDQWASPGIVRPNSTPGQIVSSQTTSSPASSDRANHLNGNGSNALFGVPMYNGAARIAGQHAHEQRKFYPPGAGGASNTPSPNDAKAHAQNAPVEEWFSPAGGLYTGASASTSSTGLGSPSASSAQQQAAADNQGGQGQVGVPPRPPRRRGKLPKPTTDFLKDWLHRHSDHPYPSEEEKKQLCNATGLSMSQVSNWMINARRRILAPANRAAHGPTTTLPFPANRSGPPSSVSSSPSSALALSHHSAYGQHGGLLDMHALRRASMPGPAPDHTHGLGHGLQLYAPNSLGLGAVSHGQHHGQHGGLGAADFLRAPLHAQPHQHEMLSLPRPQFGGAQGQGQGHTSGALDYGSASRLAYTPQLHHPQQGQQQHNQHMPYMSSSVNVPLSSPPFFGSGGGGGGAQYSPGHGARRGYTFPDTSQTSSPGGDGGS